MPRNTAPMLVPLWRLVHPRFPFEFWCRIIVLLQTLFTRLCFPNRGCHPSLGSVVHRFPRFVMVLPCVKDPLESIDAEFLRLYSTVQ